MAGLFLDNSIHVDLSRSIQLYCCDVCDHQIRLLGECRKMRLNQGTLCHVDFLKYCTAVC